MFDALVMLSGLRVLAIATVAAWLFFVLYMGLIALNLSRLGVWNGDTGAFHRVAWTAGLNIFRVQPVPPTFGARQGGYRANAASAGLILPAHSNGVARGIIARIMAEIRTERAIASDLQVIALARDEPI